MKGLQKALSLSLVTATVIGTHLAAQAVGIGTTPPAAVTPQPGTTVVTTTTTTGPAANAGAGSGSQSSGPRTNGTSVNGGSPDAGAQAAPAATGILTNANATNIPNSTPGTSQGAGPSQGAPTSFGAGTSTGPGASQGGSISTGPAIPNVGTQRGFDTGTFIGGSVFSPFNVTNPAILSSPNASTFGGGFVEGQAFQQPAMNTFSAPGTTFNGGFPLTPGFSNIPSQSAGGFSNQSFARIFPSQLGNLSQQGLTVVGPLASNNALTVVTNGAGQSFLRSANGSLQPLLPGINPQSLVGVGMGIPGVNFDLQGTPLPMVTNGLLDSSNLAALALGVNADLVASGNLSAFNGAVNPQAAFGDNALAAQHFAAAQRLLAQNSANVLTGNEPINAQRTAANLRQQVASDSNLAALALRQAADPNAQGNLAAMGFAADPSTNMANMGMLAAQSNASSNLAALAFGNSYGANGNLAALALAPQVQTLYGIDQAASSVQLAQATPVNSTRTVTSARVYKDSDKEKEKKKKKSKKSQRKRVAARKQVFLK